MTRGPRSTMEDDRVQVDLGIAAEIEEKHIQENAIKQPKRRFVGRRTAAGATKPSSGAASIEDSGAIQGTGTYPDASDKTGG